MKLKEEPKLVWQDHGRVTKVLRHWGLILMARVASYKFTYAQYGPKPRVYVVLPVPTPAKSVRIEFHFTAGRVIWHQYLLALGDAVTDSPDACGFLPTRHSLLFRTALVNISQDQRQSNYPLVSAGQSRRDRPTSNHTSGKIFTGSYSSMFPSMKIRVGAFKEIHGTLLRRWEMYIAFLGVSCSISSMLSSLYYRDVGRGCAYIVVAITQKRSCWFDSIHIV